MEWIKDAIDSMTDSLVDGLTDFIYSIVFGAFKPILSFFIKVIDSILIEPNEVIDNYVSTASTLINSLISSLAICIIIFKMVQVMKKNAEGTAETPMYYFTQVAPSALLVGVLPWLVDIMTKLSYTGTRAFLDIGEKSYIETLDEWKDIDSAQNGFIELTADIGIIGSAPIMLLAFLLMLTIFTVIFVFQFVSRIADLVVMKIVAPLVAVSLLADENNYLNVWWRELLAISIQLPLQMFTFFGGINLFFVGNLDIPKLLLGIGMFIITVKSPSFIRSMCYSTGSGRMAQMAGMSATRMIAQRMIMR